MHERLKKWLGEPVEERHIPGTGYRPHITGKEPGPPPNCRSSVVPEEKKHYVGYDMSAGNDMTGFSMCVEAGFVGKRTNTFEAGGYRYEFSINVSKIE